MNYLNQINFLFLILINIYLILNSYFISRTKKVFLKPLFHKVYNYGLCNILLFQKFDKKIIKFWFLFFVVVTIDLLIEYIFGKNMLGNEAIYPGRLAGFTGDELKIGGFYFGFIFLSLSFLINQNYRLFYIFSIIFYSFNFDWRKIKLYKNFLYVLNFFLFFISTFLLSKKPNYINFIHFFFLINFTNSNT